MWKSLRLVAGVMGVAAVMAAPGASQEPTSVTVGTWNVEWLGTPSMRSAGGRSVAQLEAIAAVAADLLDIEVLVLVEINIQSAEWATLRDALAARGYAFVHGAPRRQGIVIAYDADEVAPVQTADPEPDVVTAFERADPGGGVCRTGNAKKPVFATLRAGEFDFTVVGVHFKSGRRPNQCSDDGFTSWVRGQQASQLVEAVRERQVQGTADTDVLVVGDFNGGFDDGSAHAFRLAGFRLLTEPANRSSSSGTLSYRKGRWASVLDHIAARPVTDREWLPRSTFFFPDVARLTLDELEDFLDAYSDHALLAAEFRTDLPDDD